MAIFRQPRRTNQRNLKRLTNVINRSLETSNASVLLLAAVHQITDHMPDGNHVLIDLFGHSALLFSCSSDVCAEVVNVQHRAGHSVQAFIDP